jgi:CelD/BcsL family acetyltransferase involved in cellulose biosynthesis
MTTALRSGPPRKLGPARLALRLVRAQALDEVARLETAWQRLDSVGGSPSSQYGWTRAALKAFSEDATPHLVAAAHGERLLAVAPLVRQRLHGVHRLFPAGAAHLGEPVDFAWSDAAALRRIAAAIGRSGIPLVFERMAADSPALGALARACRGRAIVITKPAASCPFIQLDESWVEPERQLRAARRDDLCRARQLAERLGAVATEIHTPSLHELPELLDTALALEGGDATWEAADAAGARLNRAVFFRQYAEAACVEGTLRICFLRIGDRVAAMQVAVESGGTFWLLKVGADARFETCAPGQLLLRETIRYAAEAALQAYEFWGSSEAWSRAWTASQRNCVSLRTYSLNPRGLAALACDAGVAGWRRWRSRL